MNPRDKYLLALHYSVDIYALRRLLSYTRAKLQDELELREELNLSLHNFERTELAELEGVLRALREKG